MQELLRAFYEDDRTQVLLLLVVLRLVLGVTAAAIAKDQEFRLSYIADFARNDLLGKVLPFFVLYGGYKYAEGSDLVIPGLDLGVVMNGAWVLVLAALVGAILNSIRDLGLLPASAPNEIAGPDPTTPDVPPTA